MSRRFPRAHSTVLRLRVRVLTGKRKTYSGWTDNNQWLYFIFSDFLRVRSVVGSKPTVNRNSEASSGCRNVRNIGDLTNFTCRIIDKESSEEITATQLQHRLFILHLYCHLYVKNERLLSTETNIRTLIALLSKGCEINCMYFLFEICDQPSEMMMVVVN